MKHNMNANQLSPNSPAKLILEKWQEQGIVPELDGEGDVTIKNYAINETGTEYLPIPQEAIDELSEFYDAIHADLLYWETQRERVTRIWLQHCPEYRNEIADLSARK
jgi:DNA-binding PadR family transcriptional regulator